MKPTRRASYVACAAALLAVGLSLPGAAAAAKHKIGKNLVVTRSIRNGAVTGVKVKDGSLTTADLAAGTIPTARSVANASTASMLTNPNQTGYLAPSGPTLVGTVTLAVAPAAMTVSDLHVEMLNPHGAGQSRTFMLMIGDIGAGTPGVACTIAAGSAACTATGSVTIPAGAHYFLQYVNGAGGSINIVTMVSYVVTLS